MRGTLPDSRVLRNGVGIIPAHAGNTLRSRRTAQHTRDHPRTCGEHAALNVEALAAAGSSPHMRGTQPTENARHPRSGIIPAHAGNTAAWLSKSRHAAGSSPHMRGTPSAPPRTLKRYGDHPRTCGEHVIVRLGVCGHWGSSPHMRGTPCEPGVLNTLSGIIPAHAGNTWTNSMICRAGRDHPRTCGEHGQDGARERRAKGSSPHMRGTLKCLMRVSGSRRIIPAHAGNTLDIISLYEAYGDHPRTCGEHFFSSACNRIRGGSSPHMRGTLVVGGRVGYAEGIIPAHAGNTGHAQDA